MSITPTISGTTETKPKAVGPSVHEILDGLWPIVQGKVWYSTSVGCVVKSNELLSGLKGALICKHNHYTNQPLSDERLFNAVNILLLMQNSTGG